MSGRLQQWSESQASPEVPVNENFDTLEHQAVYGQNPDTTTGLTWGYYGGRWGGFEISNGTLTLVGEGSPTPTNYVVVARATGVTSVSADITNWNNTAEYARVYKITTNATAIVTIEDHRVGPHGVHGQRHSRAWNQQTADYTLVLTDADNWVAMSKSTAVNLTIPPNSSVAFPVGTRIPVYQEGAGEVVILPGSGVTIRNRFAGSPVINRSAGQYAVFYMDKRATNEWIVSGDLAS